MAIPAPISPIVEASETTGVILAIDYGQKRLGLALSDEQGLTSRPFATWTRINRRRDLTRLRDLARQQGVRRIVVGLPLHLDGSPSEMSEEAKSFAARVEKALGVPVDLMDERLSSWEAGQTLSGRKARTRPQSSQKRDATRILKARLDDVAAAIILRDYLNRTRPPAGSPV
jgi:putative Holliday junction resolvase